MNLWTLDWDLRRELTEPARCKQKRGLTVPTLWCPVSVIFGGSWPPLSVQASPPHPTLLRVLDVVSSPTLFNQHLLFLFPSPSESPFQIWSPDPPAVALATRCATPCATTQTPLPHLRCCDDWKLILTGPLEEQANFLPGCVLSQCTRGHWLQPLHMALWPPVLFSA